MYLERCCFVGLLRNGSSGGCTGGSTVVEVDDERVDITEELEELFRRDQAAVKEDIRKFISERHISQSAIAKATKNGKYIVKALLFPRMYKLFSAGNGEDQQASPPPPPQTHHYISDSPSYLAWRQQSIVIYLGHNVTCLSLTSETARCY